MASLMFKQVFHIVCKMFNDIFYMLFSLYLNNFTKERWVNIKIKINPIQCTLYNDGFYLLAWKFVTYNINGIFRNSIFLKQSQTGWTVNYIMVLGLVILL